MQTEYLKANLLSQGIENLYRAAQLLEDSELVAFPTETVYGVGARVCDEKAIRKIFTVKGRSTGQALLVHISNVGQLSEVVRSISLEAKLLMESFWPGPLSIILPAHENLPSIVTGGNPTVGVRMPSHPVAQKLIDITGPLAATSANRSGRPSPLTAEHVKADLNGMVAAIVEGGPDVQGIESTIIDLSREPYVVLRRGFITVKELEGVLNKQLDVKRADSGQNNYATSFKLKVAKDEQDFQLYLAKSKQKLLGIINFKTGEQLPTTGFNIEAEYSLPIDENGSAFFSILRDAEDKNLEILLMAPLPQGLSESLRDRIDRAAGGVNEGV